jgi:hypothetical protein
MVYLITSMIVILGACNIPHSGIIDGGSEDGSNGEIGTGSNTPSDQCTANHNSNTPVIATHTIINVVIDGQLRTCTPTTSMLSLLGDNGRGDPHDDHSDDGEEDGESDGDSNNDSEGGDSTTDNSNNVYNNNSNNGSNSSSSNASSSSGSGASSTSESGSTAEQQQSTVITNNNSMEVIYTCD